MPNRVQQTVNNPLSFAALQPVQQTQAAIQPVTAAPQTQGAVATPTLGQMVATPAGGQQYSSAAVAPGQYQNAPAVVGALRAPDDVVGIEAGQIGQFSITPNERVAPSRMIGGPSAPGQYFGGRLGTGLSNALATMQGYAGEIDSLEDATYRRALARIAPGMEQHRDQTHQMLVERGIPVGSEAYNREMNRLDRGQADARENLALSSVAAGRGEHSRLNSLAQALRAQEFGEQQAALRFDASEAGRARGEDMDVRRFLASEEGRNFAERLTSNQQDFGQRHAARTFDASESSRRFGELSHSQDQEHRINLANRYFDQSELDRVFSHGLEAARFSAGEDARRQGDSFRRLGFDAAEDQRGVDNRYRGAMFQAGEDDRMFGQRMGAAGFEAGERGRTYGERMGSAGFHQSELGRLFGQQMAYGGQRYGEQMGMRQQGFHELMTGRQEPLQQAHSLAALLNMISPAPNPGMYMGGPTAQYSPGSPYNMNAHRASNPWARLAGVGGDMFGAWLGRGN